MIGRHGERGSRISVLAARHDDNEQLLQPTPCHDVISSNDCMIFSRIISTRGVKPA